MSKVKVEGPNPQFLDVAKRDFQVPHDILGVVNRTVLRVMLQLFRDSGWEIPPRGNGHTVISAREAPDLWLSTALISVTFMDGKCERDTIRGIIFDMKTFAVHGYIPVLPPSDNRAS